MPMMDDYAGAFDPAHGLGSLSRRALAVLGREYMLFGHLLNRAALPIVHVRLGPQDREDVAIEEWMGASPIYSQRMQRAMRFEGDGVGTIMRNLQLDVGFAHQYMDVRYALDDETRGSFWLQRCGALLEVEPHGEAAVFSMCHAIEDPTFDATAVATNPRARCRPVHRPPRTGRLPTAGGRSSSIPRPSRCTRSRSRRACARRGWHGCRSRSSTAPAAAAGTTTRIPSYPTSTWATSRTPRS
jgi:hypothetical protein